jgi:hypothetical protein
MEYNIAPYNPNFTVTNKKEQEVSLLNISISRLTDSFIQFQSELFNNRSSCNLFTMMFNADIDHILLEAKRYQKILFTLQNRMECAEEDYKIFWTQNMAGHAKVMRGELDPTEIEYFNKANQFSNIFDVLTQAEMTKESTPPDSELLSDTKAIRDFKEDTTHGIISCRVQAIMLALYVDHLLREANHFLFLLQDQARINHP